MTIQDPELRFAVRGLSRQGINSEAEIAKVAHSLYRNEINLLLLKRKGLPYEIVDACFLLSRCIKSLIPERIEKLRKNKLAKSIKIRELRSLLKEGDCCRASEALWEVNRGSILRALDILENGLDEKEAFKIRPEIEEGSLECCSDLYEDLENAHDFTILERVF